MRKIINPYTSLYAVGVIQPVAVTDLQGFIAETFNETDGTLPIADLQAFLDEQVAAGRTTFVWWNGRQLYSLTEHGNLYLSPSLRRLRDKFRVYLLRDAHRRKITESRTGRIAELVGASPTVDTSTYMKSSAANKLGSHSVTRANQVYWPRSSRQFQSETGSADLVRDTYLPLISFSSVEDLRQSRGPSKATFDFVGIGLCLGLSPELIAKLAHTPELYYREFSLPKKGGGTRIIRSPRLFLKIVQWFLAEFILDSLPISEAVHSFQRGRSIVSNALGHENRAFVANIDIENFFGSISRRLVSALLKRSGFEAREANAISRLVTAYNSLPQGAPTSPIISNSILGGFDATMLRLARRYQVSYSRYADDITLSADNIPVLEFLIDVAKRSLQKNGLQLNEKKTRIASRGGQQRVTGVVVNEHAVPPRILRRKIRAIFHRAATDPGAFTERTSELGGYIGYLNQFPRYLGTSVINEYKAALRRVRIIRQARALQASTNPILINHAVVSRSEQISPTS